MSETYVVTVTKLYHEEQETCDMCMFAHIKRTTEVLGSVEFVVDRWTTEPEERACMHDAAVQLFYMICDGLVEYTVDRNLIYTNEYSDTEIYWGEFIAQDDDENVAYEVSIFRHYLSPSLFDNTVLGER